MSFFVKLINNLSDFLKKNVIPFLRLYFDNFVNWLIKFYDFLKKNVIFYLRLLFDYFSK